MRSAFKKILRIIREIAFNDKLNILNIMYVCRIWICKFKLAHV